MFLEFRIEGDVQLSRNLTKLDADMKDWTDEFKETGEYLQTFFSGSVFDSEGSVFNEPWVPLSLAYAKQKAKKYPGEKILVATGAMRDNFQFDAGALYVRIFNPTPYFPYHQSSGARRGNLPRRIMMKLSEQTKQDIIHIFTKGAQKAIDNHFH